MPRREWSTRVARSLRRRMTQTEAMLWVALRDLPWRFRRQEPIDRYVVDFVCYSKRLIVEVDGSQHAASEDDVVRDERLEQLGFRVLRVWSWEVMSSLSGVMDLIREVADSQPDHHLGRAPRRRG